MKPKRCKQCGDIFQPERSFTSCCSFECAINYAKAKTAKNKLKQKNKAIKEFNENDRKYLTKIAQQVFNKFIRKRDGNKCISCGATNRQIHAGHFRPVGRNAKMRFNEKNCHSQCSICNNHLSGNLVAYREAMVGLYGIEAVESLENDNSPYKFTIEAVSYTHLTLPTICSV